MKNKCALILRGAISNKTFNYEFDNSLYQDNDYVNFISVSKSIRKHIIQSNLNDFDFDIFIHSWNTDLKHQLLDIYAPVDYLFENNKQYSNDINNKLTQLNANKQKYSQISQCLAIQKGCELVESYVNRYDVTYSKIILYRPDVLLWKDMFLNEYDTDNYFYINGHPNFGGDFHFIMNYNNMLLFKNLYTDINTSPIPHEYVKKYLDDIHVKYNMDNILPGKHQEVLRKLKDFSYNKGYITEDIMKQYNLALKDI